MLLVSVFIIIMAIVARVKINKVKPDDTPGMFQNAIEIIVEMLGTMVDGIMVRMLISLSIIFQHYSYL